MEYVVFWFINGAIGAVIGHYAKGRPTAGFWWGFFLSIIGWAIVALGPDHRRKCGFCQKSIEPGAVKCPYCQTDFRTES